MLLIPTVDDWFQLALKYPQFKRVSHANLKDYGVMQCIDFVRHRFAGKGKDIRVLEFGHGFNPEVMRSFQEEHEVWGADRDQGLAYFKGVDWDGRFQREVAVHCPKVKFVRELLTETEPVSNLPDSYFDVILSVSVLEEMSIEKVCDVLQRAFKKLRPGGVLIGTHDLDLRNVETRLKSYVDMHRKVGFRLPAEEPYHHFDWLKVLLEQPLSVMLYYQGVIPEAQRKFWGHFATAFTVAEKPA